MARKQLMHEYVQKSTTTTLPRNVSGVSGAELSHVSAPAKDGTCPSRSSVAPPGALALAAMAAPPVIAALPVIAPPDIVPVIAIAGSAAIAVAGGMSGAACHRSSR